MTDSMLVSGKTKLIKDLDEWRSYLASHWSALQIEVEKLKLESQYERFLASVFLPVLPTSKAAAQRLVLMVQKIRFCSPLAQHLQNIYKAGDYTIGINELIRKHLLRPENSTKKQDGLDWLLLSLNVMPNAIKHSEKRPDYIKSLLSELRENPNASSGFRVQAHMISAGQNVVFAGRDVQILTEYYHGNKNLLNAYLGAVRATWNQPELSSVLSAQNPQAVGLARLHQIYTHVDVWKDNQFADKDVNQLTQFRFRAIEQDLTDARRSVLETIASEPLIVVTGGPGTGKSALCRFIVSCLAYACDHEAESRDKVDGLASLGASWIHGALLPLYVNLRNFCADKSAFPSKVDKANAQCLLNYIRKTTDSFAPELEKYLNSSDVPSYNIFLTLDGLDEVYSEDDRLILQRIIENWADRYPKCRVLVTSRSYAYRKDSRWRLSERFFAAELAPLTWSQIAIYIENWYSQAAIQRSASFGGHDFAEKQTKQLAKNLIKNIHDTRSLWPLARQPLLLAMLTLIHETNRQLPSNRAQLYEQTVGLLDRWNVSMIDDELAKKFAHLQLDRVRAALKLVAYDLQCQQNQAQKYPASIHRKELLERLLQQQQQGNGLGASIEDVLEYLNTRNGILLSDTLDYYRFPHLSIQEYLAACALIEQYDECPIPSTMKAIFSEGWEFPENLAQLLKQDPYRWRNATLFAGSIIASGTGQDLRWQLIEALLPDKLTKPVAEDAVLSIYIAAEIWAEAYLKTRARSQITVQDHLIACLEAIKNDNRLDAPERTSSLRILSQLKTSKDSPK